MKLKNSEWTYQGEAFTSDMIDKYQGFVYLITFLKTGQQYIGKKNFYFTKTKSVNSKKKKVKIESNWKNYWSSSEYLKELIEEYGEENFTREILYLCRKKSVMNYYELKEQILRDVLLAVDENGNRLYLNENICLRYYHSNIQDN